MVRARPAKRPDPDFSIVLTSDLRSHASSRSTTMRAGQQRFLPGHRGQRREHHDYHGGHGGHADQERAGESGDSGQSRRRPRCEKDLAAEQSLRGDVLKSADEIGNLEQETAARGVQRDVLATMVSAVEHKIQQRRQKLDGAKQADFDLARNLSEVAVPTGAIVQPAGAGGKRAGRAGRRRKLSHADQPGGGRPRGPSADRQRPRGVRAASSRSWSSSKSQAKRQIYKLARPAGVDRNGRAGGRFPAPLHAGAPRRLARDGEGPAAAAATPGCKNGRSFPTSDDLGEPVRLALEQGSDFRQALAKILPGRTTITIWVYPDGFDAFRQIRKELYRLGYAIAARPLPPGTPISGSPEGSKSAAQ